MTQQKPAKSTIASPPMIDRVARLASIAHPARTYFLVGAVLGLGAPIGFLALRRLLARDPSRRWWIEALWIERAAYTYMAVATPVVFGIFGRILGRQQEKLRSSYEHIERLREEFAAVVTHDLRNPIAAILLHIDSLLADAREGVVMVPVETLHRLQRSGQRLGQMVNDLLDASRIEAARLSLRLQLVSLPDAVRTLIDRVRPTLGDHPIEIAVQDSGGLVSVDPARLDQIVTNLLDNAAKYSPDGSPIFVRIRTDAGTTVVSVEDRGWGIPRDELPRLFDRFYQAKRAREKKSGLGLGLYITKGLVEAQGGGIWVDTEPDRGSTFHVRFPIARQDDPSAS